MIDEIDLTEWCIHIKKKQGCLDCDLPKDRYELHIYSRKDCRACFSRNDVAADRRVRQILDPPLATEATHSTSFFREAEARAEADVESRAASCGGSRPGTAQSIRPQMSTTSFYSMGNHSAMISSRPGSAPRTRPMSASSTRPQSATQRDSSAKAGPKMKAGAKAGPKSAYQYGSPQRSTSVQSLLGKARPVPAYPAAHCRRYLCRRRDRSADKLGKLEAIPKGFEYKRKERPSKFIMQEEVQTKVEDTEKAKKSRQAENQRFQPKLESREMKDTGNDTFAQQRILRKLADQKMTPFEDLKKIYEVFDLCDVDKSGLLDEEEFGTLIKLLIHEHIIAVDINNLTEEEVNRFTSQFHICDSDNSGEISFEEFLEWYQVNLFSSCLNMSKKEAQIRHISKTLGIPIQDVEAIRDIFRKYDTDDSGFICEIEFRDLLGKLLKIPNIDEMPEKRLKTFWNKIDTDGSGEVSFEEFLPWYYNHFAGSSAKNSKSQLGSFYSR